MPAQRGYELRLPGDWPPESVTINGHPVSFVAAKEHPGWRYEGNTLTTIVRVTSHPIIETIHIRVHRAAGLEARRAELDGFAGKMVRLRRASDTLNSLWPLLWSPDSLIDAMQSGDRLTYHPETASREIQHFHSAYAEALSDVRDLADRSNVSKDELVKRLLSEKWKAEVLGDRARLYSIYVQRALAQIMPRKMRVADE
jgi:alpha-glucosidase